ncbi:MAG TPA: hypothetical protein VK618_01685 [Flavitalea sp.]|nr:hypothetical protein [Flavitalea sp.]
MTNEQIEGLWRLGLMVLPPVAASTIWLVTRTVSSRDKEIAKTVAQKDIEVAKIQETSTGAKVVKELVTQYQELTKSGDDLDKKIEEVQKEFRNQISGLAQEIRNYTLNIIQVLKK